MKNNLNNELNAVSRPPIVVVLGHVDHGKSSILDYIRQTKVVDHEAGGITQHIGAYQVKHQEKFITFLDTPGHEAFSAMRSRGAKVADIALLVVAADDGVKPQTIEAISHIKKSGLPTIVVFNKVDKPNATIQVEKIKQQLARQEILIESLGGEIPSVLVSAKTGQGIEELLEIILLVAEMEEIKTPLGNLGQGIVIESHLDSMRGPTATLLLLEGELKKRDLILTQSTYGTIKILENFQGRNVDEASASMPILVCGFKDVPVLGEKFEIIKTELELEEKIKTYLVTKQNKRRQEIEILNVGEDKKVLNLILKTDVTGSIEAIKDMLKTIPQDEVVIRVLKAEAGEINENDIKLAGSSGAKIVGFHTRIKPTLQELAQRQKSTYMNFDVIYELIQAVRELVSKKLSPDIVREDLGRLKILAVFRTKPPRMIVGGKVTEGSISKPAQIEVWRDSAKIGQGRLLELQRDKKEADEVERGREAGISFEGNAIIEVGDILSFYRETKQKKELKT